MILDAGHEIENTKYEISLRKATSNSSLSFINYLPNMLRGALRAVKEQSLPQIYHSFVDIHDVVPRSFDQFQNYAEAVFADGVYEYELDAIESSDYVVINAEGIMFTSSNRCTRSLFFLAYLSKEYFNTDCIITNVTLDSYDGILHDMVKNIFPKVDEVVFREPLSAEKYSQFCKKYEISVDPVFYYSPNADQEELFESILSGKLNIRPYFSTEFDPSEPYVCITGNSIYQTQSNFPVDEYLTLCRKLKEICSQIILVVSAESDERLLSPIAEKMGLNIIGLDIPVRYSSTLISNANLCIGGRYHPTIFAIKGGVPVVPFSANTHKIRGLFNIFDIDKKIYDPFRIENKISDIVNQANDYLENGPVKDIFSSDELSDRARKNIGYLD